MVDTSSGTIFESIATYSCALQYNLLGSSIRTCRSDGNWSNPEPVCRSKLYIFSVHTIIIVYPILSVTNCSTLPNLENGQVNISNGTAFGSVATFQCNAEYMLSHQEVVLCAKNGTWTPSIPICFGKSQ